MTRLLFIGLILNCINPFVPFTQESPYTWCSQGPDNFSGRMRAVCVDRNNDNHVYAGGVSGGLFESFDGGEHWHPITTWNNAMNISSISQSADGTLFVAAGYSGMEAITNTSGLGLYYWDPNEANPQWNIVSGTLNSIIFCMDANTANNKVFFGTPTGLFTWDKDTGGAAQNTGLSTLACFSLKVSSDGQVVLTKCGTSVTNGLFVSQNGGQDFQALIGNDVIPMGSSGFKMAISPSRINGHYICYLLGFNNVPTTIFRSEDSGQTWTAISPNAAFGSYGNSVYASTIAINPNDYNQVYIGSIDLFTVVYQATEETAFWEQLSLSTAAPSSDIFVPPYHHSIVFGANNRMYIATDSGITRSDNVGLSFKSTLYNLHTTQINSLATDGAGRLIAGTISEGSLYNDGSNATSKSFTQIDLNDHFDVAMSFYNPNISFSGLYYGGIKRVVDGPNSEPVVSFFYPDYVGYAWPALIGSGSHFHFATKLALEEDIQEFTLDTVYYSPAFSAASGTQIQVPSLATGNELNYILNQNVYFDELVNYYPALTIQDYQITDINSGLSYQLYPLTWSFIQGSGAPEVGDVILISAPFELIVTVGSVLVYDRYFAKHPITMKILDMGTMQQMVNVAWDTLAIPDTYQSIFLTHARLNGGEIYATRDALRLGQQAKWARIADNIGQMHIGEMVLTRDLEHIYVGTATGLWRIDGFKNVFSTQDDFHQLCDLRVGTAPAITKTLIFQGAVSGISVNPNNSGDVLITTSGSSSTMKVLRSSSANTATGTGTFENITTFLPLQLSYYDCLIDVNNPQKLLVASDLGVYSSNNGGQTWLAENDGMGKVKVNRIIQNWRIDHPNTTKPGEIYLATDGKGVYSTGACVDYVGLPNEFNEASEEMNLLLYPNPVEGNAHLLVEVQTGSLITVDVISISGQQLYTNQSLLNSGRNDVFLPLDGLEQGIYIVRVKLNDTTWSTKFIKI
jgi:hypothetical protein